MSERAGDPVAAGLAALRDALGGELVEPVDAAVAVARRGHDGQLRRSGEPYLVHPLAAAAILAEAGWDPATVAAGVCHDVLEDTTVSRGELAALCGEDVAQMVEGVTRMDRVRTRDVAAEAADVQRLLGAVAGDVRVLAVKLADRLHNIRTLEHLGADKRERIARQTLEILAPLAHRIGAQAWARELEDRCFYWAYREQWDELDAALAEASAGRDAVLDALRAEVSSALGAAGVDAVVEARTKGRWSTWRKLVRVGELSRVWDQLGLRVVVGTETECYAVLGVVHSLYKPVPGRVKDYIALPKDSGYRSLHTTLVDDDGHHFEVQIRDAVMDREARYGVAAHHRYKAGGRDAKVPGPHVQTDAEGLGPEEFLDELRRELADTGHILVLTPDGDVVTLASGSCAVDFAYAIHTEVGHRCVGARVNGRLVPIRSRLATGDIVEILTKDRAAPSRDWLEVVATAAARSRIRRWFSQQDRDEHERAGRAAYERAAAERGAAPEPGQVELRRAGVGDAAELYRLLGAGRLTLGRVFAPPAVPARPVAPRAVEGTASPVGTALVGLRSQVAGCCRPTSGDRLVGYVSVGRGLIVHLASCPNVATLRASLPADEQGRLLDLAPPGSCTMVVHASDRDGLLADVAAVFAGAGVSLTGSGTTRDGDGVTLTLGLPELDPELRDSLLAQVRSVRSVRDARLRLPS